MYRYQKQINTPFQGVGEIFSSGISTIMVKYASWRKQGPRLFQFKEPVKLIVILSFNRKTYQGRHFYEIITKEQDIPLLVISGVLPWGQFDRAGPKLLVRDAKIKFLFGKFAILTLKRGGYSPYLSYAWREECAHWLLVDLAP